MEKERDRKHLSRLEFFYRRTKVGGLRTCTGNERGGLGRKRSKDQRKNLEGGRISEISLFLQWYCFSAPAYSVSLSFSLKCSSQLSRDGVCL